MSRNEGMIHNYQLLIGALDDARVLLGEMGQELRAALKP